MAECRDFPFPTSEGCDFINAMLFSNFLRRFAWMLAATLLASARGGVPVPENFPGPANFSGPVTPVIPTAKTLILPLTAYDPDGGQLSFTAKSSNPNILVRVRTGNPLLRLTLSHAGASPADPAYSGDLVFPLFRQLTPATAGWIAGLAEGGFYNGLTLHRLADLHAENSPPGVPSFVYQGGDPNGDGTGGPGFTFQNELDPSLIFSGRGLLAMANAGYDADYRGTNGSQFFITDGRVALDPTGAIATDGRARLLDFQYTIFGQLTHGWPLLDNLMQTPTGASRAELPSIPVNIVSAGVVPQYIDAAGHVYTDAVLVLSAKRPGTASITVTVSDNQVPSHTVRQTFLVEEIDDTVNDPPFLSQFVNTVAADWLIVMFVMDVTFI